MDYIAEVIGQGKVGLPLTCVIAEAGINVYGVDTDKEKTKLLINKKNPIKEEPGIQEILEKRVGKNLAFSTGPSTAQKCNVHILIVPLFIDDNKQCDFSILQSASSSLAKYLKKDDLVVLETTVPVGTTENLIKNILEKGSGLKAGSEFFLAYSPERIMTGYSISRYKNFPKIVGGINKESTNRTLKFYSLFCKKVEAVKDTKTAELIKISEGIYRDVNIALANELLKVCDHYNIDFWELRKKANHQFCNIHEAGNVGGHCIPVYPWFLINNFDVPLIKTARLLNDDMINYYEKKVEKISKKGKVGVIGLSYRKGVKEKAYARSRAFIALLQNKGYEVYGIDSMYSPDEINKEFGIPYLRDFNVMDVIVIFNKEKRFNDILKHYKDKIVDIKNTFLEENEGM